MKYALVVLSLLFLSSSLVAEERLRDLSFFEDPLELTAVPGKQRHLLVVLPEPGIGSSVYAVKGTIRYQNVQGEAYLQLDNDFGERGTYFTKGIAPDGPLGNITGSSDWRSFVLPFYANSGSQAGAETLYPELLTLSLYLPGTGTVWVRDVEVYQYQRGEDPLHATQWFNSRTAGWIGGIGGALFGLWGALLGVLSSRGMARNFVLGSANALVFVGSAAFIAGVVAVVTGQPYAVYFPLLLLGAIVAGVFGLLRGNLSARYEQLEIQKMQSMDI